MSYRSDTLFFAASDYTPKGWVFDHVGFVLPDRTLLQMSGHRQPDGVFMMRQLTDDPAVFSSDAHQTVRLPRTVAIAATPPRGAQNCSMFVAQTLSANGIAHPSNTELHTIFKRGLKQKTARLRTAYLFSDIASQYLYHVTEYVNLPRIAAEGLKPGTWSRKKATLFLTEAGGVAYWFNWVSAEAEQRVPGFREKLTEFNDLYGDSDDPPDLTPYDLPEVQPVVLRTPLLTEKVLDKTGSRDAADELLRKLHRYLPEHKKSGLPPERSSPPQEVRTEKEWKAWKRHYTEVVKELGSTAKAWHTTHGVAAKDLEVYDGVSWQPVQRWKLVDVPYNLSALLDSLTNEVTLDPVTLKRSASVPSQNEIDHVVRVVRSLLDPSMQCYLKPLYKRRHLTEPELPGSTGYCYVAAEAVFHLLGGKSVGLTPMVIKHEGGSHWYLRTSDGRFIDPTWDQFSTDVPYRLGKGLGFLTGYDRSSDGAQALIQRAEEKLQRVAAVRRADKMDEVDLSALKRTPLEWQELLSQFPEGFVREIVEERPQPDQKDIEWVAGWKLNRITPVEATLKKLIGDEYNQDSVARTPVEVVEAVNKKWGTSIKPGKVYDQTPGRYFEYAKLPSSSAKPSVMLDGGIIWGVGRFIAALLRGDKTMKVWDVRTTRKSSTHSYAKTADVTDVQLNQLFPRAGRRVDGREVRSGPVDNTSSIGASFNDYEVLPGVREIPMALFGDNLDPYNAYYAADDIERCENLAAKIKRSGEISPLIIVVDHEGPDHPYVLEGGHRSSALYLLGAKSFPSLVVLDQDEE